MRRTDGALTLNMTETQDDSNPEIEAASANNEPAPRSDVAANAVRDPPPAGASDVAANAAPPARTDMTVAEMRDWLRKWIADATGQSADAIDDSTPMVELGLSSRDAVAMASDIEDLTGVTLTATVAFRHPTIESLATVIVEGEPEIDMSDDDQDWSRTTRLSETSRSSACPRGSRAT